MVGQELAAESSTTELPESEKEQSPNTQPLGFTDARFPFQSDSESLSCCSCFMVVCRQYDDAGQSCSNNQGSSVTRTETAYSGILDKEVSQRCGF